MTGLVAISCSESLLLEMLLIALFILFAFYIVLTTAGVPIFYIIGEIDDTKKRRIIGYATIVAMLILTLVMVLMSPMVELMLTYVDRYFPEAAECVGLLELDSYKN